MNYTSQDYTPYHSRIREELARRHDSRDAAKLGLFLAIMFAVGLIVFKLLGIEVY